MALGQALFVSDIDEFDLGRGPLFMSTCWGLNMGLLVVNHQHYQLT